MERKAARQRAAALQRAEHGKPPLGVRLTGYTRSGEVIDSEAAIVRELFDRFAAGDSLRALAAWLTEAGVSTRHGRPWNPSSVRTILTNPRYAGHAVYQGKTNKSLAGNHHRRLQLLKSTEVLPYLAYAALLRQTTKTDVKSAESDLTADLNPSSAPPVVGQPAHVPHHGDSAVALPAARHPSGITRPCPG
ncbi:recombinase family protein [Amycolatopsis sp. NPDC051061]|uniref:recombinase family protein n=1 Tax=Amycolatopsis sp. NPDC051061 TaxID=3155042 RepID=UPI00341FE96C